MYSQNDEERVILEFFQGFTGIKRFLDIGAHDGRTFSNTKRLNELGWTGTLVEPSSRPFSKLMDEYKGTDNALVNVAVVPRVPGSSRILAMNDSRGDFVSTADEKHRALWAKDIDFQPVHVGAVFVEHLLWQFPGAYSFVNLDVEGINYPIFCDLIANLGIQQGTALFCVEYQDKLEEITKLAHGHGFVRLHVTSENVLLGDRGL